MHKFMIFLASTLFLLSIDTLHCQVTGLEGWTIYLDPGHSQKENMGLYNYSEAEKVLRVALALRDMLLTQTDIDTVYMSRTNDQQFVTLSQRTTHANNVAAHFYYSIHSDASGSPSTNSTLLLHGGWRQGGQTVEKSPQGGKKMGDIMVANLTAAMRIGTRGNYADRTFYEGFPFEHTNKWPYLHVNRESNMASVLSEAGFHTSTTQQQRNLNAEWKRLEAQSAFWSILEYHNIGRPPVGIVTGFITDIEGGLAVNGATVTINGSSYATDTYEALFSKYSTNPNSLRNGFYYLEDLPQSQTLEVIVSAAGYDSDTTSVTVRSDNFTFHDVQLHSNLPPRLLASTPAQGATGVLPNATLQLTFSRPLLRSSAEGNFYLLGPSDSLVTGVITWSNSDRTVSFKPVEHLVMDTTYKLVVGAEIRDLYNHRLDGNGDGVEGDSLVITFRTKSADVVPPALLSRAPEANTTIGTTNHVINITFDEPLDTTTITNSNVVIQEVGTGIPPTTLRYSEANGRGAINIYSANGLRSGRTYRVRVSGVADQNGNPIPATSPIVWEFSVSATASEFTTIDDFNAGLSNWWQPGASGSTMGIDSASFTHNTSVAPPIIISSTGSGQLRFFWRTGVNDWLIREYLGGGAPRLVLWRKENTRLQVYIYGDASGTLFRFAVDDSVGAFSTDLPANHEVSMWTKIDWVGWRLVEWDLETDPVGTWLGNGRLEGMLRFDSFQIKYEPGASASGQLLFDQLQLARSVVTDINQDPGAVPRAFALQQNYPNPFNPETRISYDVGYETFVKLTVVDILGRHVQTLVAAQQPAGSYTVSWNGRDEHGRPAASGLYLYRLHADQTVITRKMTLLK